MFSTKRLGLLLAALLAVTMSFGIVTSGAWFTDTDTVAVTATSGGIDVEWSGPNSSGFTAEDLMPADSFEDAPKTNLSIYNTGSSTTAVKYRVTDSMTGESYPSFYSQIWVRVAEVHCGPNNETGVVPYVGPLADLSFTSAVAKYDPLGINFTACYTFQFVLAQTAGNEFQNRTATFNLNL
jgi:hypothetical protein